MGTYKNGCGCPTCGTERAIKANTTTNEVFIESVKKLHPNLIFDDTKYKGPHEKVEYACQIHGTQYKNPYSLLKGHGCPNCSLTKKSKPKLSKKEWINRFVKKHGHVYNYDLLPNQLNNREEILIGCNKHGLFKQAPRVHENCGCPKCGHESRSLKLKENPFDNWTYTNWEKSAKKSKTFDSFKVYIIRCYNNEESFYKVGKTFSAVKYRFSGKIPYDFEVIKIFESLNKAREISLLEHQIQRENKEYKYIPKIFFKGNQECFSKIDEKWVFYIFE